MERRLLVSDPLSGVAKALCRASIVEADVEFAKADRFQQGERADCDAFDRLNRLFKRKSDRALAGKAEDFVRPNPPQQPHDATNVTKIERHQMDRIKDPQTA